MSYSFLFKLIIIGDSGVGKSCILLQFASGRYREKHEVTIGVEFGSRVLKMHDQTIKLQVWDTAGQQSFRSITRGYYKNAIGAVVCYDICSRDSFNHIQRWLEEAKTYSHEQLLFILVGNKSDEEKERRVSYEQGMTLAKQNKMPFLECSAKKNLNIESIFTTLTSKIMERISSEAVDPTSHPGIKIGSENKLAKLLAEKDRQVTLETEPSEQKKKKKCCREN